ncbi:MAG: energy transducer TonB [Flavobacterium sp.]
MKLDLLTRKWIDIVFEGRNKAYGAYQFRKDNPKTTIKSLLIGAFIFSAAIAAPFIISLLPEGKDDDEILLDQKIVTVKLPPKEQKEEVKVQENKPLPPPPPPVDQVKFTKPVVSKTEDVTEEPPKIEETKGKLIGDKDIKGNPDAPLTVAIERGDGPINQVVEGGPDETIYNSAGIEVKPDFPGGIEKFYKYIAKNYQAPDDENFPGGRVYVTFVVEKDGSLTDIKVLRDAGFGTGKEALRVLSRCPKWNPGEQNGKKVRVLYSLPISIPKAE